MSTLQDRFGGELMMDVKDNRLTVTPITTAIGGIVEGVDLREEQSPEVIERLRAEWLDRGVLFFPKQQINEQQLDAFVGNFGKTITEPTTPFDDQEKVHGGETAVTKKVTEVWHSDATWLANPPMATGLRLVKVPPVGGDTCWASATAAFDGLIESLQAMLEKLKAVHWSIPSLEAMSLRPYSEENDYIHPVVTVHPETGRKTLFVNEGWTRCIVELPPAQSVHLLALLYDHIKSPAYTMRWRWSPGDVALWDNRAVQHFAVPDYDGGRVIQRVVTEGWSPRAVATI